MLIENLTDQIKTMNENHREDNDRLHTRLDEYNKCNQENTKTLTHQGGKIKGLRADMDEIKPQAAQVPALATSVEKMKPYVEERIAAKAGKAWVLKTAKWVAGIVGAISTVYLVWTKIKGM